MAKTIAGRPWGSLNWPNRISLLRLALVPPFVLILLHMQTWPPARYAALAMIVLLAISDTLDGTLARRMGMRTKLGALLDPLADKVLIVSAVILLSLKKSSVPGLELPDWVVVAVMGKDLWVVLGFIVLLIVTGHYRIQPSIAGKTATVVQLAMVIAVLLGPDLNRLSDGVGTMAAKSLWWAVAVLSVLAIISYTRQGLIFVAGRDRPMPAQHSLP